MSNEKDEELFEDELTNSSKELKITKKRLNRGRQSSVYEGKFAGNRTPFGYKRKKLENEKGFTLEAEPKEAIIVVKIFNMYAYNNLPMEEIVKQLDKSKLKPRMADCWSKSSIKEILRNPVYIGKIRWNYRQAVKTLKDKEIYTSRPRNHNPIIVDGLHKQLIEKETWDITQERLKNNKPPVQHNNTVKNPLQHILVCEKCGSYMQRRPYYKQNKEPTIMCTKCDNISSKICYVEEKIIEALKYWLKSYSIDFHKVQNKKLSENIKYYEKSISQLRLQIENENKQLDKVCEAFESGIYTVERYKSRYQQHIDTINILKNTLEENQEQLNKEYAVLKEKELLAPRLENVIDIYFKLESAEDKNNLLKTVVEKVTYLKEKPALKKSDDPTDFKIRIYPKLPKQG